MGEQVNTRFTSRLTQNGSDEVNTGNTSTDDSDFWNLEDEDQNDNRDEEDQNDNNSIFKDRESPGTWEKIAGIFGSVFAFAIVGFFVFRYIQREPKPHFVARAGVNGGGIAYEVAAQIKRQGIGTVELLKK